MTTITTTTTTTRLKKEFASGLYVGELNKEQTQRHGRGVMKWSNSSYYIGDWKNDLMSGKGFYCDLSSYVYEGDWLDGLRHGRGYYKWNGGSYYEGDWSEGFRKGFGIFYFSESSECDYYKGEWKASKMHGKGEMRWKDGTVAIGEWENDQLNGEAMTHAPNGNMSSAIYVNDYKEGQGSFVDLVFKYTFEGRYTHDERREGTIRWFNGDSWEGCYFPEVIGDDSGEQESEGVMTFAETGNTLRGRWTDIPLRNGKGEMTMWIKAENREVIGEWMDGKFRELPNNNNSGDNKKKQSVEDQGNSNDQPTTECDTGQRSTI